jgi:hypothetical protein
MIPIQVLVVGYDGAWRCPYHPRNSIVSDMSTGLYICRFEPAVTSVEDNQNIPSEFLLAQNYPNPFNPSTRIKFSVAENVFVNLEVYNMLGEKVAQLINEIKPAGEYEIDFDATGFQSGIYLARLTSGKRSSIIKMS